MNESIVIYNNYICRHLSEAGLSLVYKTNPETRAMFRRFMALPVLPQAAVVGVFQHIADVCADPDFVEYVRRTYIEGVVFQDCVSVFGLECRTNNDVEGWHSCMM